jgi:lysophospholipase
MMPPAFEEPSGFQWGKFTNAKGADIRYGSLQPDGVPKGTMVVVTGFHETVEKYFEVAREMAAKGFAVWIMDWRGQGGSGRFSLDNPQKMHNEGYDEHIDTLHQFADKVVAKSSGPLILSAHSMGAHIGLRYLKEHDGVFDSALLTAPMFDFSSGGLPKPVARQIVKFAKAGNYLEKYVPGGGDWSEAAEVLANNKKTSDPERARVAAEIYKGNPALVMGDPTYGWVYHTFASIDILNDEAYLKSITTPLLVEVSGDDAVIDKAAGERALKLLPNCARVDIPGAKHEIWMEKDEFRKVWTEKVDGFLQERLKGPAPPPKKPKQNNAPRPPKNG